MAFACFQSATSAFPSELVVSVPTTAPLARNALPSVSPSSESSRAKPANLMRSVCTSQGERTWCGVGAEAVSAWVSVRVASLYSQRKAQRHPLFAWDALTCSPWHVLVDCPTCVSCTLWPLNSCQLEKLFLCREPQLGPSFPPTEVKVRTFYGTGCNSSLLFGFFWSC